MADLLLSRKHIYRLRKELAGKIMTDVDVTKYCVYAGLTIFKIDFSGDPWKKWGSVIGSVITQKDKALKLLEGIIKDYQENEIFIQYYKEIASSKSMRLAKLAAALKQGKCVVFLGPDVLKVRKDNKLVNFNESLCATLAEEMDINFLYYDKDLKTNLAYMAQCFADNPVYADGDTASKAKQEYDKFISRRMVEQGIFEDLSQLPLRLVINANADNLLYNHQKKISKPDCSFGFYDISNKNFQTVDEAVSTITVDNYKPQVTSPPMVYNIFGSYQVPDSVLFTESQFLDFIKRVLLGNPRLHSDVLRELSQNDSYLFLGFDFEQWYFKVLFQLFNLKKEQYSFVSCGFDELDVNTLATPLNPKVSVFTREFYEHEFKMFFVNDDIRNLFPNL